MRQSEVYFCFTRARKRRMQIQGMIPLKESR